MRTSRATLLLAGLTPLLAPLLGGCVAAAVGAGTALVTQEFTQNATLAFLEEQPDVVWSQAKATVERLTLDPMDVDEERRALRANIDGATVTVHARAFDAEQTRLAVTAKKWGFYDAEEANTVITRIKRDLKR